MDDQKYRHIDMFKRDYKPEANIEKMNKKIDKKESEKRRRLNDILNRKRYEKSQINAWDY